MPEHLNEIERIRKVYNTVYKRDPTDRSYIWHPCNPVSVYYRQALEKVLIAIFNDYNVKLNEIQVLDVGCGGGGFLRFLVSLGGRPPNLHGLDLMPYRINNARSLSPSRIGLNVGNAEALPYPDHTFDLVTQFTVFSSILDFSVRKKVAGEMMRVLKPGGYFLWYDMRRAKSHTTRGLEAEEIRQLLLSCSVLSLRRLHPPYASLIAKRSLFLCELWDQVLFFKKTHYLVLLQKESV